MPPILTHPDSPLWLWIDRGGILLGYFVLGGIAIAFSRWWARVRREERNIILAQGFARDGGARRVALVVTTPESGLHPDVVRYLTGLLPGWSFPDLPLGADDPGGANRCPIVLFENAEKQVTASGADGDLERLRSVAAWLKGEGFSEIHLFMLGPIAFGAAVGCLFANWGAVHVHHWNNTKGTYEYWFPLAEVKRIPDPRSVVDDLTGWAARRRAARTAAEAPHA